MENEKRTESAPTDEFMYRGNSIPRFFRYLYIAFFVWAVAYFATHALPDLLKWLA